MSWAVEAYQIIPEVSKVSDTKIWSFYLSCPLAKSDCIPLRPRHTFSLPSSYIYIYVCIILIGYDLEVVQQGNVKEGEPNPVFQRQREQLKFIKRLAPPLMAAIVALSPILNPPGQISYIYTHKYNLSFLSKYHYAIRN